MKSRAEYAKPQRDTSPQTHPHRRSIGASGCGMQWRKWLFPPKVKRSPRLQPGGGWAQPRRVASLHSMRRGYAQQQRNASRVRYAVEKMAVPTVGQKRQRRVAPDFSRGVGGTTTTRRVIARYAPGGRHNHNAMRPLHDMRRDVVCTTPPRRVPIIPALQCPPNRTWGPARRDSRSIRRCLLLVFDQNQ